MKNPEIFRRDFLRFGSLGLAAAVIAEMSFATQRGASQPGPAVFPFAFNARDYGTMGDGKTLDTDAVNRAIGATAWTLTAARMCA